MDFLTAVHPPTPPMKPIESSPDGTLPLPLLTTPAADLFESDPFFNPPAPASEDSATEIVEPVAPEGDEPASDDIPFEIDSPESPEPPAPPTAEERLLESIVGDPPEPTAQQPQLISAEQLELLRAELDSALKETQKAGAAREKAQLELQALKTRLSALGVELAAAQEQNSQANQLRNQTEVRFAEAEKQWTEKLSQLRRMLDEVEDTRDEVFRKRVSKPLFVGTVITAIVAVIFAYLIGTRQSVAPPALAENVPAPNGFEPQPEPVMPSPPLPANPAVDTQQLNNSDPSPPPPPPPAPPLIIAPIEPEAPVTPHPPKPIVRASEKKTSWPSLSGSRWNTTTSPNELKVVFHYGTFSRGAELSSTARQDLKAIAANLKGKSFRIEVEGHTDSTKVSKAKTYGHDNHAIGLARAKAVASYLTGSCGLPSSMVTTSSAGETNPPYPNTTAANQQKNRTVILKITAR